MRITAGQTDPARSQWVLTARESGETLTIQAQEGGKTPAVSSFDFGSTGLTPTQLLARAHHDFGADTQTTRILLKDGSVLTHTGTAGTPFQTASLQYWENNPAPTRKNGIVNPSYKQAGLSTFAKDSDGDGLIDVIDRQPQQWNVSERDLRMFASLAYENESALKTLFNGHNW